MQHIMQLEFKIKEKFNAALENTNSGKLYNLIQELISRLKTPDQHLRLDTDAYT